MTYVIIGGGVVGLSVACHLGWKTDKRIVVLERGALASETTAKSGSFFGFHVEGSPATYEMKRYGLTFYNRQLQEGEGWVRSTHLGRLEVARSKAEAHQLREDAGTDDVRPAALNKYVDGLDLNSTLLVPDLRTEVVEGAIYRPNVACFQPRQMALVLAARAKAAGVQFQTGTAVTDLLVEDGAVVGVETESDQTRANHVVCAVGPWVTEFAEAAGLELPVRHTLGPMLRLRSDDPVAERLPSVKDHDTGVYLRRDFDGSVLIGHRPGGYQAGSVVAPDDVPDQIPEELRETMRTAAAELVPPLADAELVEEWVGVRTLTPDEFPIVDSNTVSGLSLTVMNAEGIQFAPAAGKLVADRLVEGQEPAYGDDVALSRFE